MSLIGSSRAADVRRMTLTATGSGEREIFVSYISEVPVWKSTYRILMPEKAGDQPLLQGWAVVDNTIGEDWTDVQLSLVAGAPQSFVQNISQPYYVRRPEIALPESAQLTPQTHEAAIEPYAQAQTAPGAGGKGRITGLQGTSSETVTVATDKNLVQTEAAAQVSVMSYAEGEEPQAEAKGLGDNFEYKLKQKITIGKNQSALVPILQSKIEAEKVTLWTFGTSDVLRALWIKNTSGLTLDGGSFNLIDANAFAGEGVLETIHPGELRLISYAADPAVRIVDRTLEESRPINRVRMTNGVLIATHTLRSTHKFVISDADTTARDVVIEYPVRSEWKLVDSLKPAETTANFYRFRVPVEAGKSAEFVVEEYNPQDVRYELLNLPDGQVKQLSLLVLDNRITPAFKEAMQRVLQKKNDIAQLEVQSSDRARQMETIEKDQARLRENMKALKGSAEERALIQRYTRELDSQEDKLAGLRKEKEDLDHKREQAQSELETMVEQIVLDERF
jgi:hypothetical protein